MTYITGR